MLDRVLMRSYDLEPQPCDSFTILATGDNNLLVLAGKEPAWIVGLQ